MENSLKRGRKSKKTHICQICNHAFFSSGTLNRHISSVHEKIKKYKCDLCDKAFCELGTIKTHIKHVHSDLIKQNNENFKIHIVNIYETPKKEKSLEIKKEPKIYQCKFCQMICKSQKEYRTHLKEVHEGEKVVCQQCNKPFNRPQALKKHMLAVHLGIRNSKCKHCDKAFSNDGQLKVHVDAVHEKLKNHKCDQCGKGFSTRLCDWDE